MEKTWLNPLLRSFYRYLKHQSTRRGFHNINVKLRNAKAKAKGCVHVPMLLSDMTGDWRVKGKQSLAADNLRCQGQLILAARARAELFRYSISSDLDSLEQGPRVIHYLSINSKNANLSGYLETLMVFRSLSPHIYMPSFC